MTISQHTFDRQKHPRFGTANPERMHMPFWELMVRNGETAWWARTEFNASISSTPDPIWCFSRFGMSRTELADGRVIHVGGEHEDWYDPDFYIYNDVIVVERDGSIAIYGYPEHVFPPTDFHSATPVGDDLWIVGSLGHLHDRIPRTTPVFRLDCATMRIARVAAHGEPPGWISRHAAMFDADANVLRISGGQIFAWVEGEQVYRENEDRFSLDLGTLTWSREQT